MLMRFDFINNDFRQSQPKNFTSNDTDDKRPNTQNTEVYIIFFNVSVKYCNRFPLSQHLTPFYHQVFLIYKRNSPQKEIYNMKNVMYIIHFVNSLRLCEYLYECAKPKNAVEHLVKR